MFYKALAFACILSSLTLTIVPALSNPPSDDASPLHARIIIAQQKYCRADADLFTVSLRLRVDVSNRSGSTILLRTPLIPYIAKVSSNVEDAKSGRTLYEITQSHYPQNVRPPKSVAIAAGKTVTLQAGYDLVARYREDFSYPQSLSAGTFAVILVLKPEIESSGGKPPAGVVDSLTTEPFIIHVDEHPKILNCD